MGLKSTEIECRCIIRPRLNQTYNGIEIPNQTTPGMAGRMIKSDL